MNTAEARKIKDFATIVRDEPDGAKIVKVPGHNGRSYFVRVTSRTVTCRFVGKRGERMSCPSTGSGTICYHALAAYEKVHSNILWCETEEDARKLENLGKHRVEVRSTQDSSAKAWAVLEGRPVDEEERNSRLLAMAKEYLELHSKFERGGLTAEERERQQHLRTQFGILKWSHSRILNFVRDVSAASLDEARKLTGTDVDYAEVI